MKTRFLMLAVLLSGEGRAIAQDAPFTAGPPSIMLSAVSTGQTPQTLHACGGGPLMITVAVDAPSGTHLRVYADLDEIASGPLLARLQQHILVGPELVFDGCTHLVVPCTLPQLNTVQRKTTMRLTIRTEPDGPDPSRGLELPLIVYPREEPDVWRRTLAAELTHSGLRRLAVFGDGQMLRRFLRGRKVAFDDLGEDLPDEPDNHTLYVGETPSSPLKIIKFLGFRLVLFTPPVGALPPGVYQTTDLKGGSIWKVTLPGLFAHPDDDPPSLEIAAEIFRQALEPRTASPVESTTETTSAP